MDPIISLYWSFHVEQCCDLAAFALIFYEYIITFDREVSLVWGRKFTAATVLFLLNRYLALLKYPIYIVNTYQISDEGYASNVISKILEVLPYFVWLSFSVLRVYAICGHSWRFGLLVALPGLFPLASNITYDANYPEPIGCLWVSNMPHNVYNARMLPVPPPFRDSYQADRRIVLISTRTSVILTDVLVLSITWWRTYGIRKAAVEANIRMSLSTLILRDGTIYFLVLMILNTFHIAFSLTGRFTWTITLEEPLTTILVSRFLLNLREADGTNGPDSMGDMSNPSFIQPNPDQAAYGGSSVSFASGFIAPLGAPLGHRGLDHNDSFGNGLVAPDSDADRLEFEEGSSRLPMVSATSRPLAILASHSAIREVPV
ncbi:hypothetical protein BV20DRAFT_1048009 [Pilatotrama ljubarskyi]|nr:hypothetical protein BV20DRAFT_1048009 [Pilatotrama ljubarskyi]